MIHTLDEKGRCCCGEKPLTYKRKGFYFCTRCDRQYDIQTGRQMANFARRPDGSRGGFREANGDDFRTDQSVAAAIASAGAVKDAG